MRRILPSFFVLISVFLHAQEGLRPSLFDSLYAAGDVRMTFTYPFDSMHKNQVNQIEALVTIRTNRGYLMQGAPMSIYLRGKFRRMTCEMPPLMLNFKKSTLRDLGLTDQDEIKLVTHCMHDQESLMNLQEELLCYQLYESLTAYSYRTIWLSVEYCNSLHPDSCYTEAGLLLEPDKNIEQRLGLAERRLYNIPPDSLDFMSYGTLAAYNFLIGNRDWSISTNRNAKLFYKPEWGRYVSIPYDFDYANIVGALYRKELLSPGMVHPFDRMYYGEYFPEKAAEILQLFSLRESALLEEARTEKNTMDIDRRLKITKYLEQWFSQLRRTNPNKWQYGLVFPYKGGL